MSSRSHSNPFPSHRGSALAVGKAGTALPMRDLPPGRGGYEKSVLVARVTGLAIQGLYSENSCGKANDDPSPEMDKWVV